MSASQKKKLRKEQNAAAMTEKQQQEIKEAKKLKLMSVAFVAAIALMIVVVIVTAVNSSGIIPRSTTALTVDGTKVSAAELNHYYIDSVNNFYNNYGSYASLFGLDVTQSLDEQVYDEESGDTWADYFLDSAIDSAKYMYSVYNAAVAEGYTLSEEASAEIDSTISNMSLYAAYYGFSDVDAYIAAVYGTGCNENTYRSYCEVQYIASQYASDVQDAMVYTDADLREAEAENYDAYSSYTYNYYYMAASKYYQGGTTDEEGTTTYSNEEKAAGAAACLEEANILLLADSLENFDAAIGTLSINAEAETKPTSTRCEDYMYDSVNTTLAEWITGEGRVEGEMTIIPSESTTTDDEGNEATTVNGYYVVRFESKNENLTNLVNVRHILIAPEGGTYDSTTYTTTYSDEEIAAAKEEAEALLAEFLAGEATEDAFAALANEHSVDDGSNTNGGLYENVYPGQMVANFDDWCFDESRQSGDTDIVQSDYGWHIIYYVGQSETTYRDYMIESDLRSNDMYEWENSLYEAAVVEIKNSNHVNKDLVLSSN